MGPDGYEIWERVRRRARPNTRLKGPQGPPGGPRFCLSWHLRTSWPQRVRWHFTYSLTSPSQSCLALLALLYSALSFVCPRICSSVCHYHHYVRPACGIVECSGRVFVWLSRLLLLIFWGYGFVDRKTVGCVCFEYRKFQFRFSFFWNLCLCVKYFTFISLFALLVISANIYRC